ncbi:hypothetical protein GH714_012082 [Hevea brasiliensis]|uniref:Uncharacterized protein n=1 Tax=Hevea brasiliensis TaxID=3981 RepID=A0A6A6L4C3_HEVBR|nr:hypothetical protein GH714_012082 [Hevea brasiliensis]
MASSGYFAPPPPVFSGGYSIWSVKMKAYLKAFDLWEVTETGRQPGPLREDPTLAQLKAHSEECAKGFKALSCIHSAVSDVIFTRIMACETAKQAWDRLKEEFHGSESSKQMSVLNLRREFEVPQLPWLTLHEGHLSLGLCSSFSNGTQHLHLFDYPLLLSLRLKLLDLLLPLKSVTRISDCDEEAEFCDLHLVSSFRILLLTYSIFTTPLGAEFIIDTFKVS